MRIKWVDQQSSDLNGQRLRRARPISRRRLLPRIGKVPASALREFVFTKLGARSERVLLGPGVGEDAAIIRMDGKVLALKADPITASLEDIGWLAVHINANDLAVRGIRPAWFLATVLLPSGSSAEALRMIADQIDEACTFLGVAVVGGHSEVTAEVRRPLVIGAMAGEGESYVTTAGARPGDAIVMTKTAGIEATRILAKELYPVLAEKLPEEVIHQALAFRSSVSVVKEAMTIMEAEGVNCMHDPTEGGVVTGLWEIAEASGHGLIAYEDRIPIAEPTRALCEVFGVDPLTVMSSGTLLLTAPPPEADDIMISLGKAGIQATIIGQVTEDRQRRFVRIGGYGQPLEPPERDPLYDVLERFGKP